MTKKTRSKEKTDRYLSNKTKKDSAKIKKEKATREKWANDKDYLKKQADKGYVKVGTKWVKEGSPNAKLV